MLTGEGSAAPLRMAAGFTSRVCKSLKQDRKAEARAKCEGESGHFLNCGLELLVAAGFQRDHERKRAFVEAGILQHGVNVKLVSR